MFIHFRQIVENLLIIDHVAAIAQWHCLCNEIVTSNTNVSKSVISVYIMT